MKVSTLSRWFHVALGLYAVAFFFQVVSQRYLFADGANFFLQVTTTQSFSQWDYPRQFAHYLTQWPIVLAIKLGVRNIPVLSTLYGVGLFMWPLAALALCDWFTPRNQKAMLVFPTFGFAYTALNSALFIISESHAAAACFWVIFFYLLYTPRAPQKMAVVGIVSLSATRMYESYAFLGVFLAVLAGYQFYRSVTNEGTKRELTALAWVSVCMLVSAGIGFWWMLYSPDRNVQTVGLGTILLGLLQDPNMWLSSILMALFLATFLLTKYQPRDLDVLTVLLWTGVAIGASLGLLTLADRAFVPVKQQYPARILNIAVPLLFAGVMLWLRRQGPRFPQPSRWMLVPVFAMVIWNTTWQTTVSGQWQAYADSVQQVVEHRHGVVELDTTVLRGQPFNWSWSMPCLSIVLDAFHEADVPAVVVDGQPTWQPFDPRKPSELPNLRAYGVSYVWPSQTN